LKCKEEGLKEKKMMWRREEGKGIKIERRKKVKV
jgi:hypothetical protein